LRRLLRPSLVAGVVAIAIATAGCGRPPPSGSPSFASSSVTASVAPVAPSATRPTTPSPSGRGQAASIPPAGVAPDPGLLALVPAAEAGATLTYDPLTTASVGADPALAADVGYLAIGLARPSAAPADDPNLAIVNVARLRDPGVGDDAWFRDWRDTYDREACAAAGGVVRHAETTIDTLRVFVTACANDAFTYHVRVADGAVILSITSIGPDDLGRRMVEKLHS
jgi:hypothetical protein